MKERKIIIKIDDDDTTIVVMCSSIIIVILLHTTAAQQPTPLHARVVDLIVLDPDLRLLTFLRNNAALQVNAGTDSVEL